MPDIFDDAANAYLGIGKKTKGVLSQDEVADTLRQAGWDEKHIPLMSAIGMGESEGKVGAFNPGVGAGGRPTKEKSYGLFQVNALAHPEYDTNKLRTDPVYNAQAALNIFKKEGLKAWGSYTDGRYKKYYTDKKGQVRPIDPFEAAAKDYLNPTVPKNTFLQTPQPETPETVNAQVQSTLDPNSPKSATLVTPGEQVPTVGGLESIPTPQGTLLKNPAKPSGTIPQMIGKAENVTDTTKGNALVTRDANGNELNSSIVTSPQGYDKQAALDSLMFPQAADQQVVPAQDVVKMRQNAPLRQKQHHSDDMRQRFPKGRNYRKPRPHRHSLK
jgi:hypothetical protein